MSAPPGHHGRPGVCQRCHSRRIRTRLTPQADVRQWTCHACGEFGLYTDAPPMDM